jgi:hypothetical protein
MKIQFFMKNGPRIHEKSFSTQKAIKRSSFCSIFNENRMKNIFWLQILALLIGGLRQVRALQVQSLNKA